MLAGQERRLADSEHQVRHQRRAAARSAGSAGRGASPDAGGTGRDLWPGRQLQRQLIFVRGRRRPREPLRARVVQQIGCKRGTSSRQVSDVCVGIFFCADFRAHDRGHARVARPVRQKASAHGDDPRLGADGGDDLPDHTSAPAGRAETRCRGAAAGSAGVPCAGAQGPTDYCWQHLNIGTLISSTKWVHSAATLRHMLVTQRHARMDRA